MTRRQLVAAVAVLAAVAGACDSINNHLLEGQEYLPAGACLTEPSAIDDLPGSDPGSNCAPECLGVPGEGGPTYFVTTTCPPYPGYPAAEKVDAAHDAADPCVGAFAAYMDGSLCKLVDGALPEAAPAEASPDVASDVADGGTEAAVEASASDAGTD